MESFAFLESKKRDALHPIYVLHGDEAFLKRQVMLALRARVFGAEGNDFGFAAYAGDKAAFADVRDELETLPLLCSRRLILVENADPFVTRYRAELEKYVAQPSAQGVLVLDVKTWPANTRLAKMLQESGAVTCKAPPPYKLPDWCVKWAASAYGKQLLLPAARLLVDLVGPDMGQLDQELAKLAVYAGEKKRIETEDVDQLVGGGRTANIFKIFDALSARRPAEALAILDRLFDQGEEPIGMLGAFSFQLRRLAKAARLVQRGVAPNAAAEQVGFPPFARQGCEQQLRHLGQRTERLYDWLLEADLGMKGSSQLPPRTILERLVVRLA